MRILVVEDDTILGDGLTVGLRLSGFTPELVTNCADALAALEQGEFAGMVLDVMLPDGSGLDVLSALRGRGGDLPVILLTALDDVRDRIAGLNRGADDYLGKPFDLGELAARLNAVIRRTEGRAAAELAWNGLLLDPARMEGRYMGREVSFSRREFLILRALLERPGAILSKPLLEERLYGWQDGVESNALEVHVHKIRAKLSPEFIRTVRGVGYRLAEEAR